MDHSSFDRLARLLGGATSRRDGLKAAIGATLGLGVLADASAKSHGPSRGKGGPAAEGPCKSTKRPDNICTKNSQCCTGLCNTKTGKKNKDGKGRCRCVSKGGTCTANRNCCSRGNQQMTCNNGICGNPAPACTPTVCPTGCTYSTVQDAVDAATAGDTIQIGEGTYVEVVTIEKNLTLEACTTATIIDTGGDRTMYIVGSAVELINIIVDGTGVFDVDDMNQAIAGGGIDCDGQLTLSGTSAVTHGTNTDSPFGVGGLTLYGTGCALTMNDTAKISLCNATDGTGGVLTDSGCTIVMNDASEISDNYGYRNGGGVLLFESTMTMNGTSSVRGNTAGNDGGGVYLEGSTSSPASLTMNNTAIITNNRSEDGSGGGVFSNDNANTLTRNGSSSVTGNVNDDNCAGGTITC
jgi:hypothetical protein